MNLNLSCGVLVIPDNLISMNVVYGKAGLKSISTSAKFLA